MLITKADHDHPYSLDDSPTSLVMHVSLGCIVYVRCCDPGDREIWLHGTWKFGFRRKPSVVVKSEEDELISIGATLRTLEARDETAPLVQPRLGGGNDSSRRSTTPAPATETDATRIIQDAENHHQKLHAPRIHRKSGGRVESDTCHLRFVASTRA